MFRPQPDRRLKLFALSLLCAGMLVGSTTWADENRPAPNGAAPATARSPMGPAGGSDDAARAQPGATNDYPRLESHDWVIGATMAARTRALFREADSSLAAGIRRAQARFERSQDYRDALAAEKQAYEDYTTARDKAVASLVQDSRYHEILRLRDELGQRLDARRADRNAGHDELSAMAVLKMEYASDARAIEMQALANSAEVKAARERLIAAGRKAAGMRGAFDDDLHENSQVAQLRRNKEEARVAMLTADAYAAAASLSADAALWYSYYLHRNDQGYYAPYGPAGVTGAAYGNGGYYSPYWGR